MRCFYLYFYSYICTDTHNLDHSFDANFTKKSLGTHTNGMAISHFPNQMKRRKTEKLHAHAHSMANSCESNFLFGSSRICEPSIQHSNDCSPTISRSSALLRRYLKSVTRVIFTVNRAKKNFKSFLYKKFVVKLTRISSEVWKLFLCASFYLNRTTNWIIDNVFERS